VASEVPATAEAISARRISPSSRYIPGGYIPNSRKRLFLGLNVLSLAQLPLSKTNLPSPVALNHPSSLNKLSAKVRAVMYQLTRFFHL